MGTELKKVYLASDSMITSMGISTEENMDMLIQNRSGIVLCENPELFSEPVFTSQIPWERVMESPNPPPGGNTKLEKLYLHTVRDALSKISISAADPRTVIILSTTKGNIDVLTQSTFPKERAYLHYLARVISCELGSPNDPVVISNACISGVMAIMMGQRYLERGKYDHAIVIGADLLTEFVISGFNAFKAISDEPCKPYDETRKGITLGEACGVVVLTNEVAALQKGEHISVVGGATSNDANHISGPSRTGDGLAISIRKTLEQAKIKGYTQVDHIFAHGTATPYNDEMEAKAFNLTGLSEVPLNSLKGNWGHTLGAAGVIESIAAIQALRTQTLIGTFGFDNPGLSLPLHIIKTSQPQSIQTCLKTASGFGGCNAAILFAVS